MKTKEQTTLPVIPLRRLSYDVTERSSNEIAFGDRKLSVAVPCRCLPVEKRSWCCTNRLISKNARQVGQIKGDFVSVQLSKRMWSEGNEWQETARKEMKDRSKKTTAAWISSLCFLRLPQKSQLILNTCSAWYCKPHTFNVYESVRIQFKSALAFASKHHLHNVSHQRTGHGFA